MKKAIIYSMLSGVILAPMLSMGQEVPNAVQPRRMMKRGEWQEGRPGMMQGEGKRLDGIGAASDFIEKIKREDPERFEELMTLREKDRPAFMKEMRKMALERRGRGGDRGPRNKPQEARCAELSKQYHSAKTEEDKVRLKEELATAVREAFEARLNSSKDRLIELEGEIGRFRMHIRKLEENREEVVNRRLDELTRAPELDWGARW